MSRRATSSAVCRRSGRDPYAHVHELRSLADLRRDVAVEDVAQRRGDVLRRQALQTGARAVDHDVERVAGRHDAVGHVDHALDAAQAAGDGLREARQHGRVVREELHLDGLRDGREIADEVFHQEHELDLEAGHLVFDLAPHVVHDLLDVAARERLQAYEEVALVGLCECAAELEAGPPAVRVDLGRGLQDRLDLPHHRVGRFERRAGRREVVQHEAALVGRREEAAADLRVAEVSEGQKRHDEQKRERGPRDHAAASGVVGALRPRPDAPRRLFLGILLGEKPLGDQRHDDVGHEKRDHERRRERDGQRP